MENLIVRITPGTRVGFWYDRYHAVPLEEKHKHAFQAKGIYTGPDLGDHLIGTVLSQPLMEGELRFSVGVLFRPDRGKHQKLETILILENWIPEMFQYEHWEEGTG